MSAQGNILSDYQLDAISRMHNGCILCGDVGSGKSRTALGYFHKVCDGKLSPLSFARKPLDLYIITTARKRDTKEWEGDLSLFFLSPNEKVCAYGTKVVIDSWNNIRKYIDISNSFFIFDEQRVIGSGAWVKAFWSIAAKNRWILLSATPGDTWLDYMPVFVANGFYKNKTEFLKRHAVYSYYSKYPKIVKYTDQGLLIKHRNDILVNMNYTRPTTHHKETIITEYDDHLYSRILKERWNVYKSQPIKNISELCYLLRFVVNSNESRSDAVLKLAKEHSKLIIFYNFNYERDILRNLAYPKGTVIAEYNGEVHMDIPKSDRWVYLVQYFAGSEAWNCIETDTIVFYSLNYSYRIMKQSSGRIDRRNTPYKDLYYYYIRSNAPIDIGIERAIKKKKNFNEREFFS